MQLVINGYGQPEFERTADLTITRGNLTIEHNFNGVRTWISGYENPDASESLFGLTGSGSAVRNGGVSVNRDILDTLMYSQSCNQVTQGVVAVTRPLGASTIDFGDGNCDDEATVTTANGNVFTLDLHRFPG